MKRCQFAFMSMGCLVCAATAGEPAKDATAIQGKWSVTEIKAVNSWFAPGVALENATSDQLKQRDMKITVAADKLILSSLEETKGGGTKKQEQELKYSLNSSKNPREIDLASSTKATRTKGGNGEVEEFIEKMPGIYELNGDTLKISFGFENMAKKGSDGKIRQGP